MSTQIIVSGAPVNQANSVMILAGNTRVNSFTTSIDSSDVQNAPNYLTNVISNATGIVGFGSGLVGGPQILVNGINPGDVINDKSINYSVPTAQTQLQNGSGPEAGQILTRDGQWYSGEASTYQGSTNFNIANGSVKSFGTDNAAVNGWNATQSTIINVGNAIPTGIIT